jgi:hypothetical protein
MKVQLPNNTIVNALLYTFPKKGNAPTDYTLTVNGVVVPTAMTGGGKYPVYTYFKLDGVSYYLPKNVNPASGSDLTIVAEPPKAEKPATEESAKPAKSPRAPKK